MSYELRQEFDLWTLVYRFELRGSGVLLAKTEIPSHAVLVSAQGTSPIVDWLYEAGLAHIDIQRLLYSTMVEIYRADANNKREKYERAKASEEYRQAMAAMAQFMTFVRAAAHVKRVELPKARVVKL